MTPKMHSALLLALGWVSVRAGDEVRFSQQTVLNTCIDRPQYNLRGPANRPNTGVSECLPVRVFVRSCKYHDGNPNTCAKEVCTHSLRIGAYGEGDNRAVIRAAEEINKGGDPPDFSCNLRTFQRSFVR